MTMQQVIATDDTKQLVSARQLVSVGHLAQDRRPLRELLLARHAAARDLLAFRRERSALLHYARAGDRLEVVLRHPARASGDGVEDLFRQLEDLFRQLILFLRRRALCAPSTHALRI